MGFRHSRGMVMRNVDVESIVALMFLALFIVLVGTVLFFSIYALVVYGNKPITEVPVWALWFLIPRG